VEAVELGEQVGGGVRGETQRIVGMLPLPLLKGPMGFGELKVVHLVVTRVEQGRLGVAEYGGG